jgi:hypothetical protein
MAKKALNPEKTLIGFGKFFFSEIEWDWMAKGSESQL